MLTTYENRSGVLEPHKNPRRITDETVWIDLLNPKEAEVTKVERALKLDVPTREEQREIEASSRLYQENGAHFMTATVLYQADMAEPVATPITFILAGNRLITLRYAEPRAFAIFAARCARPDTNLTSGMMVLIGLIEAIVDRLGRLHRAHPGRGRHAVAFDLRDERRRGHPATALRRVVEVDRAGRGDHVAGP